MSKRMKFFGFIALMAILVFSAIAVYSAGTVTLPQTGQVLCYDSAGSVISCNGTGQDGDPDKPGGIIGETWPSPRFSTATADTGCSSTDCVKDMLTGLVWFKSGATPTTNGCTGGTKKWVDAVTYITCLNSGTTGAYGNKDWRLPNVNELKSLLNTAQADPATWLNGQGFSGIPTAADTWYWASTTYQGTHHRAWGIEVKSQILKDTAPAGATGRFKNATSVVVNVLPVRGGI